MKKPLKMLLTRTKDQLGRDQYYYGLGKVHKVAKNVLLPVRPILPAIGAPTYKLTSLPQFLKP